MATKRLLGVQIVFNNGNEMAIPIQTPISLLFVFRTDVQECPEAPSRLIEVVQSWDPSSQSIQSRYTAARNAAVAILEAEQNGPHTVSGG